MAIYRTVQTSFWSDTKVEEEFTPEDKYFYLYLFTNPHNNLCGCYSIGIRQISKQIGYTSDVVEKLLDRFENVHKVIEYSKAHKILWLKNWSKHNWLMSSKYLKPLRQEICEIECEEFKQKIGVLFDKFLAESLENARVKGNEKEIERLELIPLIYPMHISITNTITISNSNNNKNIDSNNNTYKEIIDYLNSKTGKRYSYKTKNTQSHINARLNEGYTIDDFKKVIDTKTDQWLKDEKMNEYLRPDTLFGSKFEGYLNQSVGTKGKYDGMKFDFE